MKDGKGLPLSVLLVGSIAVAALAVVGVRGATSSASLSVTTTVVANCTIATGAVAFGNYDPVVVNATAPLDATGSVTIACTKGTTTTVGLDTGGNAQAGARRMTDGTEFLGYELYKDTYVTPWGNTGGGVLDTGAAPSRDPRVFTVYGRVAASQDVQAGAFTDSVVATVNF